MSIDIPSRLREATAPAARPPRASETREDRARAAMGALGRSREKDLPKAIRGLDAPGMREFFAAIGLLRAMGPDATIPALDAAAFTHLLTRGVGDGQKINAGRQKWAEQARAALSEGGSVLDNGLAEILAARFRQKKPGK